MGSRQRPRADNATADCGNTHRGLAGGVLCPWGRADRSRRQQLPLVIWRRRMYCHACFVLGLRCRCPCLMPCPSHLGLIARGVGGVVEGKGWRGGGWRGGAGGGGEGGVDDVCGVMMRTFSYKYQGRIQTLAGFAILPVEI